MQPIEFESWDGETRYALTVGPLGQVLSSTTNRLRAPDFPFEVVSLEARYRFEKEERQRLAEDSHDPMSANWYEQCGDELASSLR